MGRLRTLCTQGIVLFVIAFTVKHEGVYLAAWDEMGGQDKIPAAYAAVRAEGVQAAGSGFKRLGVFGLSYECALLLLGLLCRGCCGCALCTPVKGRFVHATRGALPSLEGVPLGWGVL